MDNIQYKINKPNGHFILLFSVPSIILILIFLFIFSTEFHLYKLFLYVQYSICSVLEYHN